MKSRLSSSHSPLAIRLYGVNGHFFVGGIPRGPNALASANEFETPIVPVNVLKLVRKGHPLITAREDLPPLSSFPVADGTFDRELDGLFARIGLQLLIVASDNYDLLAKLAQTTDFILVGSVILETPRPELGLVAVPHRRCANRFWGVVWVRQDAPS